MREARLEQARTDYPDFDELCKKFQPFFQLISTAYESKKGLADYSSQPLLQATFSYTEADTSVKQWQQTLTKLARTLNEDYPDASDAATEFRKLVNDFSTNLELMYCVMSEAVHDEDWQEIKKAIGNMDLDPQTITVTKFEELGLSGHV